MAQYSTGTIDITAGTNVVTGTGTLWAANAHAGDMISMDGGEFFVIASVDSDTQLTLSANYPATLDDVAYLIVSDFTPNKGLPLINQGDLQGADIVRRALQMIDSDIANTAYDQFAYDSELTSGLDLYLSAGRVRVGGVVTAIAAGAVTLTDNATNYIEINAQAGTIVDNTTGFSANNIPLYTAVTAGGAITTVTDKRSAFAPRSVRICPVANIASPLASELGNGAVQGEVVLAYQAAGSAANFATLYTWDTSSAAENKPYIVAATGGSWIGVAGRASAKQALFLGGLNSYDTATVAALELKGNQSLLNKAGSGYLAMLTRNTDGAEAVADLEYIGKINGAIREQGGTCILNTLDAWKTIAKFTLADFARVGFHGVLFCNDFGTYPGQRVDFAGGAYRSGTTVWFKWGGSAIGLMDLTTALRVQKIDGEYAYEMQIRNPGASGAWTQMAWKIAHADGQGETYSTRTVYSTPQAAGTSDASQASITANHKVCAPIGSFSSSVYAPIFYPYAGSADLILQLRNDSYDFSFRNAAGAEVLSITSGGVFPVLKAGNSSNTIKRFVSLSHAKLGGDATMGSFTVGGKTYNAHGCAVAVVGTGHAGSLMACPIPFLHQGDVIRGFGYKAITADDGPYDGTFVKLRLYTLSATSQGNAAQCGSELVSTCRNNDSAYYAYEHTLTTPITVSADDSFSFEIDLAVSASAVDGAAIIKTLYLILNERKY